MNPLVICFTQNLNYALGWMVIHSLWQAVAIAFIAGIGMILLRKKAAAVRYWVSNASLLAVLLAAILTFSAYYDFDKEPEQIILISSGENIFKQAEPNATHTTVLPIAQIPLSMEGMKEYFNQHIYLIVTIWAMGVALFILRLLGGISYLYFLRSRLNFPADEYWYDTLQNLARRTGVTKTIDLVESALVRTPMIVGHLKPVILFPIGAINRLSVQEVEGILAHEIAHVLRHDYIFNIIQSVIEALFFFHPAVWWLSANIRNERENCCDDMAIEICGNSMAYAKSLVTLQEMAYYTPQYAMGFAGQRKHQLLNRVQRILNQPQNKANVMEKLIATCFLVLVMIGLSFGENNNINSNNEPSAASVEISKPSEYFLKYTMDGQLDSFPLSQPAQNGNYNYKDNLLTASLVVQDNAVTSLKINGVDMSSGDISKFEDLITRMVYHKSEPNKVLKDLNKNEIGATVTPNLTTSGNGLTFSDENMSFAKGQNGVSYIYTDDNGSPSFTIGEGNRINLNGKTLRFPEKMIANPKNITYIDGNHITMYDEKGVKSELTTDNNGGKILLISDGLIEPKSVTYNNGKIYIGGIESTEKELNKLGWTASKKGLQPLKGFQNIRVAPKNSTTSTWMNDTYRDAGDDIDMRIDGLKEQVEDLKSQLDECDCGDKNTPWVREAKARLSTIVSRAKAHKTEENLDKLVSELDDLRSNIRHNESYVITNDCDDCPTTKGSLGTTYSYSIGSGNTRNQDYRNADLARRQAQTEKALAQRKADRNKAFAQQNDKYSQRNNNTDAIRHNLFQSLVDAGYISLNKKCSVTLTKEHLKVNGKSLDNTPLFKKLKAEIDSKTGKKGTYLLSFSGIIKSIDGDDVELEGSMSTSNSTEND